MEAQVAGGRLHAHGDGGAKIGRRHDTVRQVVEDDRQPLAVDVDKVGAIFLGDARGKGPRRIDRRRCSLDCALGDHIRYGSGGDAMQQRTGGRVG